jgi:hypothetical protein
MIFARDLLAFQRYAKLRSMICPLCRHRKARRVCPALQQTICTVCCGSKRLTEIACTSDCVYLTSSREHPAAAVKRQQERDVATLLPTIRHLTERQYQLFFLLQSTIARHAPEGLARLLDADVADAAGAVAATLETASRGVIYEHAAQTLPGQKLAGELKATLEEIKKHGARVFDHEAAVTLRAIEQGARDVGSAGNGTTYLELMRRLLEVGGAAPQKPASAASSLILPP